MNNTNLSAIIKTDLGDVIVTNYISSNIHKSWFFKRKNELIIEFKSGALYLYKGISIQKFRPLQAADSTGKHFWKKYRRNPTIKYMRIRKIPKRLMKYFTYSF